MDALIDAIALLLEKKRHINPNYLTRDAKTMKSEIDKQAHKRDDDPTAYKSHRKGLWKADYDKKGNQYKTKPSKWTLKLRKATHEEEGHAIRSLGMLQEAVREQTTLNEALGKSIMKSLKNKAKLTNSPLGALTTVYRKGMAAWKTGHRPGVSQHQWAMGRVNSFLGGGKARKVDAAQWARVVQYRKHHKKSD
jgi:hypothetical protein